MTTNEFERDLNDQAGLKRPGRIDLRVFQNTPDAGDGHPGVQRCFRNYLHEGGMEKDLELVGYSIKGTSVDINNVELQQLSNIGTTTISAEQWIFVGQADQDVRQADSPTFASPNVTNLNLADDIIHIGDTNNLISFGTDTQDFQTGGGSRLDISDDGVRFGGSNVRVTGIINNDALGTSDVALCTQGNVKAYVDAHADSTGSSHTYIDQDLKTTFSPTFVGLTLSANLVTTSTVDGVDVSTHTHGGAGEGGTVDHVNLSNKGSNAHSVIDTHLGSTSNPHTVTAQQAFTANKTVSVVGPLFSGCNSETNSFLIGEAVDRLKFWHDGSIGHIKNAVGILRIESPNVLSPGNPVLVIDNDRSTDNKTIVKLEFSADSGITVNDRWITFYDSGGEVGYIDQEVVYNTFTGGHNSQTLSRDLEKWVAGMILVSSGKIIVEESMSRSLPMVKLSSKRKDKCVLGVFTGFRKEHNTKGFDKTKPAISLNALGEGRVLVTDTNGNIENGDYIQSSIINGLGEKQDDDILHNYTVAKATQSVNWNKIKAKNGIKKKLIACTYHCG